MSHHLRRSLPNSGRKAAYRRPNGLKHVVPCALSLGVLGLVRSALARPSRGWSRRAAAGCRQRCQRADPLLPRPFLVPLSSLSQLSSSSSGGSFAQLLGPVRELKAYLVCHELCRHGGASRELSAPALCFSAKEAGLGQLPQQAGCHLGENGHAMPDHHAIPRAGWGRG